MSKRIFRPGGPHNIRHVGGDRYEMSISIPADEDGRTARECPNTNCSPAYFKVMGGTGIVEDQEAAYCPYCRHEAEPDDFMTQEQIRYAKDIALSEAQKGISDMFKDALGVGPSGRKKLGGGLVSLEMTYKADRPKPVRRPVEDEVRRDVTCPRCGLDQTVFGLATWCADCGEDIFLSHLEAEIQVTRKMLEDIPRRESELGKRVGAKDLENCLEDAVSIFEASAKALIQRYLSDSGKRHSEIDVVTKKIGNSFQNIDRARKILQEVLGYSGTSDEVWSRMKASFEKRHPVTHNLGVVDKKYLERAGAAETEGRELRISNREVSGLLDDVLAVTGTIHEFLFSS